MLSRAALRVLKERDPAVALMLRATVQARASRLAAAAVVALCLLAVAEVACRIARLAAKRFIQLIE